MTAANWCACTEKLIPPGVLRIYEDGRLHSPDACVLTDDLAAFDEVMSA